MPDPFARWEVRDTPLGRVVLPVAEDPPPEPCARGRVIDIDPIPVSPPPHRDVAASIPGRLRSLVRRVRGPQDGTSERVRAAAGPVVRAHLEAMEADLAAYLRAFDQPPPPSDDAGDSPGNPSSPR